MLRFRTDTIGDGVLPIAVVEKVRLRWPAMQPGIPYQDVISDLPCPGEAAPMHPNTCN
ncbi:MAG: hypothetical protein HYX27_12725 [Acidobacteria bacterium]|nr:hypothetical protein [Acidobacteriota bacterium]